jgi:hypothetical protein
MRYQFHEFGPVWARVLLACSRLCDSHLSSKALALDLAASAEDVATSLMQLGFPHKELRSLAQTCMEHHGTLLKKWGKFIEAERSFEAARKVAAMTSPDA